MTSTDGKQRSQASAGNDIFIDVDKTFLRGHCTFGLIRFVLSCHGVLRSVRQYGPRLFGNVFYYLILDNLLFYDRERFAQSFCRVFAGVAEEDALGWVERYHQGALVHRVHPYFEGLLARADAEDRVTLISGSPRFLLEGFLETHRIDNVIASRLETRDGRFTGAFVGQPTVGRGKYRAFLEDCESRGADPRECTFYTDHYSDLDILEAVGTPTAFQPDAKLRRIARQRGWHVV